MKIKQKHTKVAPVKITFKIKDIETLDKIINDTYPVYDIGSPERTLLVDLGNLITMSGVQW